MREEEEVDLLRRRQYENPPVVEAIARLQWSRAIPWTFTTPGLLFERLKDEYPEEPKAQSVVRAEVLSSEASPLGEAAVDGGFQLSAGPQRIMFGQRAGTRLLGVSATDISAHGLHPYEGWESLEARLHKGIERVLPVASEEMTVSGASVRYINRVEVATERIDFEEYLTIGIVFPPGYPPNVTAFLDRVEMEYPGESVKLAFTWASVDAVPGHMAFILDLDLIATGKELSVSDALGVLSDLKVKEGRAFEALLQDRLRDQFGEKRD